MRQLFRPAALILLIATALTACSDETDKVSQENTGHMFESQQQALEKAKTVQDTLNRAYDAQQQNLNQASPD